MMNLINTHIYNDFRCQKNYLPKNKSVSTFAPTSHQKGGKLFPNSLSWHITNDHPPLGANPRRLPTKPRMSHLKMIMSVVSVGPCPISSSLSSDLNTKVPQVWQKTQRFPVNQAQNKPVSRKKCFADWLIQRMVICIYKCIMCMHSRVCKI